MTISLLCLSLDSCDENYFVHPNRADTTEKSIQWQAFWLHGMQHIVMQFETDAAVTFTV